jgi:hypothetical protein
VLSVLLRWPATIVLVVGEIVGAISAVTAFFAVQECAGATCHWFFADWFLPFWLGLFLFGYLPLLPITALLYGWTIIVPASIALGLAYWLDRGPGSYAEAVGHTYKGLSVAFADTVMGAFDMSLIVLLLAFGWQFGGVVGLVVAFILAGTLFGLVRGILGLLLAPLAALSFLPLAFLFALWTRVPPALMALEEAG